MKKTRPAAELTKEELLCLFRQQRRPLSHDEVKHLLKLDKTTKRILKELTRQLVSDGSLVRLKSRRFGIPDRLNLELGTLACTRSGNGFVITDTEGQPDIFVPARFIKNAFHGDKVVVRVEHTARGRKEGKIVKVTERRMKNVVGFVKRHKDLLFLMPEDERIGSHFIVEPGKSGAKLRDGDLVACKITRFPDDGGEPECRVLKAFDGLDDVKAISQFITYKHNLPLRFKKSTGDEAKGISCVVPPEGRLDLRATRHVTIDGEFAKDFDDAVCIEKKKNGYLLHVSIADVAHYVTPGSALDGEAYERGTSVYFPGSVIPMLPKELSNDICSLKPREDRLTMTATLHFNNSGDLIKTSFAPSVIRSARRLTYTKVEEAVVAHDRTARKDLADVLPELDAMAELATLLKQKRNQRGALDFDLPEPEVILDIEGGISDILRSSHLFSHAIIEELMVATNEAVARFVADRKAPLMYRVHEPPDRGKLVDVEALLQALGVPCERDAGGALPLTAIVEKARGKPYEFLVSRVLLRSMKQAHYSSKNAGHFGLALDHYIHFTSPIRRYPDLVCHRVLKALLAGSKAPYDDKELERMALHLSQRERVAMEAERDLEDRVRVLFMKERLGEVYEGVISRITSFGFFVELSEVFVQGLVMLSGLHDDYYSFQEDKFRLIGTRTKRVFRIGDTVRVKVLLADAATNRLHFGLVRR